MTSNPKYPQGQQLQAQDEQLKAEDKQLKPEESDWCPHKQELTIYLDQLLKKPVSLTLRSWHNGISWINIIEGEIEPHHNPFEASLFPIEFMGHDILNPWRAQIPNHIMQRLKRYRGNPFGMLNICSRYSQANDLFTHSPTLFWLLFMHVQNHSGNELEFIQLCQQKQTKILKFMGYPAKKSAIKLISKMQFKHYTKKEQALIMQILHLDYDAINHRAAVSFTLIAFVTQCPELINSPFIRQWEDETSDSSAHNNRVTNTKINDLVGDVQDIRRMAQGKPNKKFILRALAQAYTRKSIKRLHDKLVEQLNNEHALPINAHRNSSPIHTYQYPAPPIKSSTHITPIISYPQLQQESRQQQHCVVSYHQDIAQGAYFVYRVLKPERATLGIKIKHTANNQLTLTIDQLRGYRNKAVTPETTARVLTWFKQRTMGNDLGERND